ncbi:MAG: hypothetical protein WD595_00745 [Waddliaceae bacterium]
MQVENFYREMDFFLYPKLYETLHCQMQNCESAVVFPDTLFTEGERTIVGYLKRLVLRIKHAVYCIFSKNYRERFEEIGKKITREFFFNHQMSDVPNRTASSLPDSDEESRADKKYKGELRTFPEAQVSPRDFFDGSAEEEELKGGSGNLQTTQDAQVIVPEVQMSPRDSFDRLVEEEESKHEPRTFPTTQDAQVIFSEAQESLRDFFDGSVEEEEFMCEPRTFPESQKPPKNSFSIFQERTSEGEHKESACARMVTFVKPTLKAALLATSLFIARAYLSNIYE